MGFFDIIKKSVIEEFTGTISVGQMALSLLTAFLVGIFIVYIYRKTYTGVVYSKSFSLCVILLAMITSLIIKTINSNLALSLGMVGALSIVRFRTAVKEPVDTGFMFWGITVGIMSGAGLYLVTIIASLLVGIFYMISYSVGFKKNSQYLFVLKYEAFNEEEIEKKLRTLPKHKLKSKSYMKEIVEVTFEIEVKGERDTILKQFRSLDGVVNASLISYQNDFGA